MVSVDTIRAYTFAYINKNYLIKNGWRKWVNRKDGTVSYFKKISISYFGTSLREYC
ncbi:hypothetical protein [Acetivibrio clariflavus]|uniref:hypothetical protein n=1 Tax=Acetivibrio clariflavus TaxID=288965 RepID=UPI0004B808BD|nr:hypothetical protein [Acetivibrio clariflavus]